MGVEKDIIFTSSFLVNPWAIAIWLIFSVAANIFQRMFLAGFFMFIFLITLCSRIWGRISLKNIELTLSAGSTRLFPGQKTLLSYNVKNNKIWPLIWFRWMQRVSNRKVFEPVDTNDIISQETDTGEEMRFYQNHLAWILWFQKVQWQDLWEAGRRGIYSVSSIDIKSGDGFGFCAMEKKYDLQEPLTVVVYPMIVPVTINCFFQNAWGTQSGVRGFVEDVTMLKGTREYENGDSWKRINWRLAARQSTLQVNLYENVNPQSIHFIVDANSFIKGSATEDEFEDALSILASVMLSLIENGVEVGLSVPNSTAFSEKCFLPQCDDAHLMVMLESLSGLSFQGDSEEVFSIVKDLHHNDRIGQIYAVTYDGSRYNNSAFSYDTYNKPYIILSYKENQHDNFEIENPAIDRIISMKSLKRR